MNQMIITSRRRSLRHAALALCAVLLALVADSCTADPLDGLDTPNPDDVLTFAVAPRPSFTEAAVNGEGTAAPATRATQTDSATRWAQDDILWLDIYFYRDKPDRSKRDTIHLFSALKYDIDKWRYLTETEAEALNTGHIPNFSRLARYPRGWKDWVNPSMEINTFYAGSGKPDTDGTLTIFPAGEIPATPFIGGGTGICSPDGKPVPLKFVYYCSRVRIPAGYKVTLENALYWSEIEFSSDGFSMKSGQITDIPGQSKDTDVFVWWLANYDTVIATLTRDGVSWTFTLTPIALVDNVNAINSGASYTLTPYTSGAETPAGYDLTVATEDDLRDLARAVNAGEKLPNGKPFAAARVLQTEDIELTQEWVPIGTSLNNPFRGAYNGNGHEITGLTITAEQPDADNWSFAGLFGRAEGAVLTGIKLRKVDIKIPQDGGASYLCVGSIAGYIKYSTLSLCSADGTANARNLDNGELYTGGIAGINYMSTISRCRADVETKVVMTNPDKNAFVGGIAGQNDDYGFILSCEVQGKAVTAERGYDISAGGITGENKGLIAFCRTGANIVTAQKGYNSNYAGGLVGNNKGFLYSCYSRATAKAIGDKSGQHAGAIVGLQSPVLKSEQYCYGTDTLAQGNSGLAAAPDSIVYNATPGEGDIYKLISNYKGKVESLDNGIGETFYPYTTHYNPSATPAYGILPQRKVWKSGGAWNEGDGKYPGLNIEEYEGE